MNETQGRRLLARLPRGARVLDYGCLGWTLLRLAEARPDLEHHGCDISEPANLPATVNFHLVDPHEQHLGLEDDLFDLVVASHLLEHLGDPLAALSEMARLTRPGGLIYLEAPSDRALRVASDRHFEDHGFMSFWDDPTHVRPFTPAAFYRMALSFGLETLQSAYIERRSARLALPLVRLMDRLRRHRPDRTPLVWEARGWACWAVLRKPPDLSGRPSYRYISLKEVPPGQEAALAYRRRLEHG